MDVAVRHNKKTDNVATDLGLKPKELAKVAGGLAGAMADTYLVYLKTQNFHWNVTGPMFGELHALFEQQYTDLAAAVDELAERIRAVGDSRRAASRNSVNCPRSRMRNTSCQPSG
jgi:DNA-binding ferritin-like protein